MECGAKKFTSQDEATDDVRRALTETHQAYIRRSLRYCQYPMRKSEGTDRRASKRPEGYLPSLPHQSCLLI